MCIPRKSAKSDKDRKTSSTKSKSSTPKPSSKTDSISGKSSRVINALRRRRRGKIMDWRKPAHLAAEQQLVQHSAVLEPSVQALITEKDCSPMITERDDDGGGDGDQKDPSFRFTRSSQHAQEMVQHWVNRALDMGVPGLMQEFRYSLAKWNPQTMTVNAFLANRDKNRYLDVPCQDQGRVVVRWPGLPNDYIHANFVANPAFSSRFICAQGPLDNTQLAFWAMVIQQKSEIVIMLCNTIECGKCKCSQYWPREKGESMTVGEGIGRITITNLDVSPMSEIDSFVRVCRLRLDYIEDGEPKSTTVRHFQWENWPDRGVPPTKLTATNMLSNVRGTTKPIVVHCSAGIGRTGTIVAIAYIREKMQHGQNCMDMDALTKELRTQRPFSIQNEYQYIYVHRVLLAYFLEKYRDRFAHILEGDGEAKYAKWREEYKLATGCD